MRHLHSLKNFCRFAAGLICAMALFSLATPTSANNDRHDRYRRDGYPRDRTPPSADSLRLEFQSITNNSTQNGATGADQLFVTVTDPAGAGNALFTFFNVGPLPSSITGVYFDDGTVATLRSIERVYNGLGVHFSKGARPFDLPGGRKAEPDFETTRRLSADANSPVRRSGVNPGESFSMLLRLQNGTQYADVLDDIRSGDLRVGMRVQGFQAGGIESFVNTVEVAPPIPEPSTLAFCTIGALLVAFKRRKTLANPSSRAALAT